MATTKQILYYWLEGHNVDYVPAMTDGQMLVGVTNGTPTPTTISGDVTFSGGVTAIGATKVTNAMLAGSIAASKLIGSDIATVGTLTAGTINWTGNITTTLQITGANLVSTGALTAGSITLGAQVGVEVLKYYDGGAANRVGVGIQSSEVQFFNGTSNHYSWNGGGDLNASGTNEWARLTSTNLKGLGTIQTAGYTVATLPAASAGLKGAIAYVTDALAPAFLTVVVGGGAVVCPVFCDGTNWIGG